VLSIKHTQLGCSYIVLEIEALCHDAQFLPTVIVDDFEDVTPELLKKEYMWIMNIPLSYWRWDHLTRVSKVKDERLRE
jgi:hypothetical protein